VEGGDLYVAQVGASVEHARNVCVTEHVGMCPGDLDTDGSGEVAQAAGGRVPVHPGAAGVQQDRPAVPIADRPVDGPANGGRQWDQDDLGALAAYPQDPVAVFLSFASRARDGRGTACALRGSGRAG
jgi:hypothetical protein